MKQKIRIWLRNFFGFSRTETNGFIILVLLMLIILAAPFASRQLYNIYSKSVQSADDKKQLKSLMAELKNSVEIKTVENNNEIFKTFDLNKSSVHQLISAGFPEYLAERIVKYRKKIKPFESKSELLKIYGMDSSLYEKIHPFIMLTKITPKAEEKFETGSNKDNTIKKEKDTKRTTEKVKIQRFDINKADTAQLQNIFGIGPAYSQRITKYRDYLGGFNSLDQLEEVYGLKKENLDSLLKYVFIEQKKNLKQLKVNQLNADSLVQHPYISYKEANVIINYRNQHGKFNSSEDLHSIMILDSSWVQKVSPYLSFE
ncbi:helix-hairpin-helix domain-containing protein [Marivirga harenae]|uniref:helix-hairpin-helix domain-containing protein n=1 Tax=Marivirga harenae TaxID=2010992 RepID=UPI0026E0636C|nr:helix-hairpin-helix domain-containing protein [Marivirga harenae]WKV13496.1 helix-hairpin-helix domain-containing protein [Marivirga harenae]